MTQVISLTGRRAGTLTAAADNRKSFNASGVRTVDRQAAIENALSMALFFIRQAGDSRANLWAATARTNRALSLLKQAACDRQEG